jgi:hypothetical protein
MSNRRCTTCRGFGRYIDRARHELLPCPMCNPIDTGHLAPAPAIYAPPADYPIPKQSLPIVPDESADLNAIEKQREAIYKHEIEKQADAIAAGMLQQEVDFTLVGINECDKITFDNVPAKLIEQKPKKKLGRPARASR